MTPRPRPRPLSPEAQAARAALPPEVLAAALQDRVHVERGKLIAAWPVQSTK
jgi:hypothetical protein